MSTASDSSSDENPVPTGRRRNRNRIVESDDSIKITLDVSADTSGLSPKVVAGAASADKLWATFVTSNVTNMSQGVASNVQKATKVVKYHEMQRAIAIQYQTYVDLFTKLDDRLAIMPPANDLPSPEFSPQGKRGLSSSTPLTPSTPFTPFNPRPGAASVRRFDKHFSNGQTSYVDHCTLHVMMKQMPPRAALYSTERQIEQHLKQKAAHDNLAPWSASSNYTLQACLYIARLQNTIRPIICSAERDNAGKGQSVELSNATDRLINRSQNGHIRNGKRNTKPVGAELKRTFLAPFPKKEIKQLSSGAEEEEEEEEEEEDEKKFVLNDQPNFPKDKAYYHFFLDQAPIRLKRTGLYDEKLTTLGEFIKDWDEDEIEARHDFIQWLFPTDTQSSSNLMCNPITPEEIVPCSQNKQFMARLKDLFIKMLAFYGFRTEWELETNLYLVHVDQDKIKLPRVKNLNTPNDHNILRITRILTCLNLFGRKQWLNEFKRALSLATLQAGHLSAWTDSYDKYWQEIV